MPGAGQRRAVKAWVLAASGTAALLAMAGPASAEALIDKYWLEASGYWPHINTNLNVSRPGMPGTDIDFENDLALDSSKTVPAVFAGARFGRFQVAGEYYALSRDASTTLKRDLVFDGATYPATAKVDSAFKSNIYRATLGYSFFRQPNYELGAGIGLHMTDFEADLSGTFSVGGATASTQTRKRDFIAPMPTVGLYGSWEPSPKVTLSARIDYLSLTVGDYSGGITNAQASVGYNINSTFRIGAAYRYVNYDLDVNKATYTAKVHYDFLGPSIFLGVGFR